MMKPFIPSTLAVIPARGGSKGISRKCLTEVLGKSLLQLAVEHALHARSINKTMVSTDDPEFAEKARDWGAEVPFLRPPELAGDSSSVIDAVLHLLANLQEAVPEFLVLIQPTTPLLKAGDIDHGFSLFDDDTDAVVSVCETEVKPDWLRRIGPSGWIEPVVSLDVPQHTARQKMPVTYRLNGAFYWCRTQVVIKEKTFLPRKTKASVMPQCRSIDVDNEFDLRLVNFIAGHVS